MYQNETSESTDTAQMWLNIKREASSVGPFSDACEVFVASHGAKMHKLVGGRIRQDVCDWSRNFCRLKSDVIAVVPPVTRRCPRRTTGATSPMLHHATNHMHPTSTFQARERSTSTKSSPTRPTCELEYVDSSHRPCVESGRVVVVTDECA